MQENSGYRQALTFPTRQPVSTFSNDRIVAIGKLQNALVYERGLRRRLDLLLGALPRDDLIYVESRHTVDS